jgi:hypothetical protein
MPVKDWLKFITPRVQKKEKAKRKRKRRVALMKNALFYGSFKRAFNGF